MGFALLAQPAWKFCRWLLDRAGYLDFITAHIKEPGWVGTMVEWMLNPPAWTFGPAIILGFAFIFWDGRSRTQSPSKAKDASLLPIGGLDPIINPVLRDAQLALIQKDTETNAARANDKNQALVIDFEQAAPCMRRRVFPAGNARYEVYVRVKNIGNGFLSELVLSVVDILPRPENKRPMIVLTPLSSLTIGEHRYVLVGGFSEDQSDPPHSLFDKHVTFADASGGLYAGGHTIIDTPSRLNPALITLEARALECQPVRKDFKLWVDDNRRLYMAEA